MPRKPIQFSILNLIWLIIAAALFCGTIRYTTRTSGNLFGMILAAMCFLGPLIWLFCRPNPFRGHSRPAIVRSEPAGPIEHRLQQFLQNVEPIEAPDSNSTSAVMPEDVSGKAPRKPEEIAAALRRIKHPDENQSQTNWRAPEQ